MSDASRLQSAPLAGVFYFRAHNRSPGGNYDMITLKVTLWAAGRTPTLQASSYRNWDGNHVRLTDSEVQIDPAPLLPKLRSLAAEIIEAGAGEAQYTIQERRIDTDEYDTEWSSIEITLLALPEGALRPEDGAVILKLEQSAVPSDGYSPRTPPCDPPDRVSQALFDTVLQLCGLCRVKDHSEARDDISRLQSGGRREDLGYTDAEMPMYL